jgi:ABC-2 type transport system ATP-binding protein
MIRVEGLTKDYGSRRAVDNISFHAERGEILGFLGPNGAGKTTTMRILTGFMPPSSGKAEVAGFDVVEQSLEVRRRVGYVPETVPLYPDMTVSDYLKFMADLRRVPNAEERVDEVMIQVNIEDRARGYIGNLSKGLKQRVGLAQALIHKPDVLILDEPTIGLDPAQIIEVRNMIRELGKERSVMLSTHILSEAQQVCDRVLIINKGKIVAEDTPERLQARLAGVQKVLVKVAGDADGLEEVVSGVSGVSRVSPSVDGGLELEMLPGQDIRPHLARTIVTANYDLIEMRQVSLSLEDIFIELTREEPEPPSISEDAREVDDGTTAEKEEYPEE